MRKFLKKNPKFTGKALYWVANFLMRTLRIKMQASWTIQPGQPYIVAFWHGKHFLPVAFLKNVHDTKRCTLVSQSRDGTVMTIYLEKQGYEVVRGSSRGGNVKALHQLIEKIKEGYSIGTGIDGPLGPRHQVKPGLVYLSQKCQVPIVPVGSAYSKYWQFHRAWDKFELPKPFAKAGLVLGAPFLVGANDDIQSASEELTKRLHAAVREAEELIC